MHLEAGWGLAGVEREGLLSSAVEYTKYASSCPACPSPGPGPLGNSDHSTQLCYLSVMLGPNQDGESSVPWRSRNLRMESCCRLKKLQAGCHLPSPTQTKYPALRVSEKFLASARPGLAGLKQLPSGNWGCCLPLASSSCSSPQGFKLIGRFIQAWRVGAEALGSSQDKGGRGKDWGQTECLRKRQSKRGK